MVGVGLRYDNHQGVQAWVASANTSLWSGRLLVNGALSLGEWRQQEVIMATGLGHPTMSAPNDSATGSVSVRLPDPRSDEPPWSTLTRDLLRPTMSLTASHETVRFYDEGGRELARPSTRDVVAMAAITAALSGGWQGVIGPMVHLSHETATTTVGATTAVGGVLRAARVLPPLTSGADQTTLPGVAGELLWTDHYRRAMASGNLMATLGAFELQSRLSLGTGRQLPLAAQLRLGGSSGFPGLMPDERRGDRVGFATIAVSHRMLGPIHWRVEVGRGYTQWTDQLPLPAFEAAPLPQRTWTSGVDAGLSTDTPIGPLTLSYGVATVARRVVKLRIGA
jgi:hypothetical protein